MNERKKGDLNSAARNLKILLSSAPVMSFRGKNMEPNKAF